MVYFVNSRSLWVSLTIWSELSTAIGCPVGRVLVFLPSIDVKTLRLSGTNHALKSDRTTAR
jgi:hypothetical protein